MTLGAAAQALDLDLWLVDRAFLVLPFPLTPCAFYGNT